MTGAFGKYTALVSIGTPTFCLILSLFFLLSSDKKKHYKLYYQGFLLLCFAGFLPALFSGSLGMLLQGWISNVAPIVYVTRTIWFVLLCAWGFLLILRGYRSKGDSFF